MSLNRTRPNEHRLPDFEELPDGRKRLTRYFDLANGTNITDGLVEAYGTLDVGPATGTTAGFANLRLVKQGLTKIGEDSVYVKVYEELPATAEVQVGGATTGNTTIKFEDGRTGYEAEFLQLVAGSYVPGTVGSSTAPGDSSAYLQREECTNDGTLRRIKRTYVYAGQIAQTDDTKNNGALLLRTITSVKTVPSTPSGYILIATKADPNAGLPILTYTFAKGDGQIGQDDTTGNNGALLRRTIRYLTAPAAANPISTPAGYTAVDASYQEADGHRIWTASFAKGDGEISRDTRYVQSADQGTTGATVITVRHLTDSATGSNPISTPVGTVLISEDKVDQDGHRVWTAVYAKGTGTVVTSTETKDGGKLIITRKTALGSAPSAPAAALGGTVALISDTSRLDSGYSVYERTWAEGVGEISRDTRYVQSSDQGTTGATVITVRHLTATATGSNPISTPAGTVLISEDKADQDGHRVWTAVYAKGTGTVVSDTETKNGGKLIITRKTALGSAPAAPAAALGGTVTLIANNSRADSGYTIYERTWAEGVGVISQKREVRPGGLVLVGLDIFTAPGTTDITSYSPGGILIENGYTDLDGVRRFSAAWMQNAAGGSPTSGTAATYEAYVPFTYPGRAKYYQVAFTTGGYTSYRAHDVFLSPPVETRVKATHTISYSTSGTVPALANAFWNPTEWATLRARWVGWANTPRSRVEGLRGYRTANSGASGTSGGGGTDTGVLGDRVYAATDWEIVLSGGPGDPGGSTWTLHYEIEPAFSDAAGTLYYRHILVTAAIAAQAALPV